MGTSLKVMPFAALADFPSKGVPRLLINRELPRGCRFDLRPDSTTSCDVFFEGDCDDGVAQLASLAGMDL